MNSTTGEPAKHQEMDSDHHTEEMTKEALAGPSQHKEPEVTIHSASMPATADAPDLSAKAERHTTPEPAETPLAGGLVEEDVVDTTIDDELEEDLDLEAALEADLEALEGLSQYDEDEETAEQPSTPGELEMGVPIPDAETSHTPSEKASETPTEEVLCAPAEESPGPTEPPTPQGSRETTTRTLATLKTIPEDIPGETDNDGPKDGKLGASRGPDKDNSTQEDDSTHDISTHHAPTPERLRSEAPIVNEGLSDDPEPVPSALEKEPPRTRGDEPPGSPYEKPPRTPGTEPAPTPEEEPPLPPSAEAPSQLVKKLPTETWSRETTAQLPGSPLDEVRAEEDTNATTLGNSMPVYESFHTEDEAQASPGVFTKRATSKSSIADDRTTVKRARTASERVFVELSAYVAAPPIIQRTGSQPITTSLDSEPTGGNAATKSSNTSATEADTSKGEEAQSPSAHLPDVAPEEDADTTRDDSDSLPDYESQPDYVDEVPVAAPAPEDSHGNESQHPQIEVAEPTPQLPSQQEEASPSNAVSSAADKRRRSALDVSPGRVTKRIRIVLKRTPSPQPPTEETAASSNVTAADANKRRRSVSDPGPRQVNKRPRIVLKRTPSPAPPQPAPQQASQQAPQQAPQQASQQAPQQASQQAPRATRSRARAPVPSLTASQASQVPQGSQAWLEDQISPKTVAPPPAPATAREPPAPKKKSARKPKPPPPDKPSTSNLTWAGVESLLPASVFGQASWIHRRLWTVKEEIELRAAWSEADESRLKITHAEVLVARFVSQLYGCRLQDLFRYGLKYMAPPPDRNGNPVDDAFWTRLLRLLPHPFFLGKIELLRYALQQAVFFRTSDFAANNVRVQPYVPPWSHKEAGYITYLKEIRSRYPENSSGWDTKTLEILEATEFRCQNQVENKMWMQELCTIMSNWAESFASQVQFPRGGQEAAAALEMYLFVLTERDLAFLECCLEELDREQRKTQALQAQTWQEKHRWNEYPGEIPYVEEHRGYHRSDIEFVLNAPATPGKNVAVEAVTVDSAFLKFWTGLSEEDKFVTIEQKAEYVVERRLAVVAERREALIRRKIGARGGGRETRAVLDVPPFDPDPDFHLFESGQRGPRRLGLMVIRGVYVTPEVGEWLYHWMQQKEEQERRRNPVLAPVEVPDSAVERVLGSGYVPAEDRGLGMAGPQVDQPPSHVGEGATRQHDEDGRGDHGARSSVVKQHAEYRRRDVLPPILSMGGGLWARRKGKGPARQ